MSNDIEKFIADNRNSFDDASPSGKVWQNVEAAMTGKEKKRAVITPLFKWSIAASALLLVGFGTYFFINKRSASSDIAKIDSAKINIPVTDPPETNEIAKLILLKQDELKTLGKDQPQLYEQFTKDITQLDSSYNALKNQLSITPNREVLIEAMIQNLQLQLNVLNQQLNIIHQIKESKKYSHEKNDQTI